MFLQELFRINQHGSCLVNRYSTCLTSRICLDASASYKETERNVWVNCSIGETWVWYV